jgi:hypothetical protein
MEHRWGERFEVDIPVQVSVPPLIIGSGRVRNVSISGAWISGRFDLPPLARAFVVFEMMLGGQREQLPIACYVARIRPDGIGVEWRELAPQIVSDLMLFAAAPVPPQNQVTDSPPAMVGTMVGQLPKTQSG